MSTKTKTCCPNCLKEFDVPAEYVGRRATCASCKNKFVVVATTTLATSSAIEPEYELQATQFTPSPVFAKLPQTSQLPPPPPAPYQPTPKKVTLDPKIWVPIAVGLCSLIIGYFAGREHLKYQIRSTMQQAFQGAFSGKTLSKATDAASITKAAPAPELPPLSIGQRFEQSGFALALNRATIGKAKLKSALNKNTVESDEDYLILAFTFSNTEDRKQRSFHDAGSTFSGSQFQLKDDVGNVIRGVDFGFSTKVSGALESNHDIPPGESVNHIKVFSLPLPKTKHVVLTINLNCLGGDGETNYMIPLESIQR